MEKNKSMVSFIKSFLYFLFDRSPNFIQAYARELKRRRKRYSMLSNDMAIHGDQFLASFGNFLFADSAPLMVHSSGEFFARSGVSLADLNSLFIQAAENRTIMMPAFPFEGLALNSVESLVFDPVRTPSKMGLLSEIFRRNDGVLRSLHPTHSVSCLGDHADVITATHEKSIYPFDKLSPFRIFEELDGKILLLGVGLDVLTHVHVAEDYEGCIFPINPYLKEKVNVQSKILDGSGSLNTFVHDPKFSRRKDIKKFESFFFEKGVLEYFQFDSVRVTVIDAKKLTRALLDCAKSGVTIYE